jgi:hypothetical protein
VIAEGKIVLLIIWNRHGHECLQKSVEIIWAEIYWRQVFIGPNLVSFNRTVVPYEISKVNFRVETKILVSMSEEI